MTTKRNLLRIGQVLFLIAAANMTSFMSASPVPPTTKVKSDFNKDGWGDLAIGVPNESVNGQNWAGAVHILYGSSNGLSSTGSQLFTQDSADPNRVACPEVAQQLDEFGRALATGDFNKDGYSDLAIGAPHDDVGGFIFAGAVTVLYGSASGLHCAGSQLWTQNSVAGNPAKQDAWFGETLAEGDFNQDGYADLAIGAIYDSFGSVNFAGSVTVLYGGSGGLKAAGARVWVGPAEPGSLFGYSLASGNFGKSSHTDLAIGIPYKKVGQSGQAGAVVVLYGSASGLTVTGSQYWTQDSLGGVETSEAGDLFGIALAAGDFGKTGHSDLAIGAPNENVLTGVVHILYGSSTGLTATENQLWWGNSQNDRFGEALVAANFGYGAQADLAIGAPGDTIANRVEAGSAQILYGSPTGLSSANSQSLNLGLGVSESDTFGAALAAANFGSSSHFDLAIGIPGRKAGTLKGAGAVSIWHGSATGLAPAQFWSQDSSGIADVAEWGDRFGFALSR